MHEENVVHIYSEILLRHKKNEIVPFVEMWTDLETIIWSEFKSKRKPNII